MEFFSKSGKKKKKNNPQKNSNLMEQWFEKCDATLYWVISADTVKELSVDAQPKSHLPVIRLCVPLIIC